MKGRLRLFLAIALVAVATVLVLSRLVVPDPALDTPALDELPHAHGYVLGQTVAAELPTGGEVVALLFHNRGRIIDHRNRRRLAGLRAGLGKKFQVRVTGTDRGEVTDEYTMFPSTRFARWIGTDQRTVAVVSFVGIPADAAPEVLAQWPPFYCGVVFPYTGWEALLKTSSLRVAVEVREDSKLEETLPPGNRRNSANADEHMAWVNADPPAIFIKYGLSRKFLCCPSLWETKCRMGRRSV